MRLTFHRAARLHAHAVCCALLLLSAGINASAEDLPTVATPLSQLTAEALQNNPELKAARKEHEAAGRRIAPAGALEDPMLEAGILSLPTNSLSFDREDMTMKMIGVSQRLPYPGKRALREDLAQREADAAGHAADETANRVVRELKTAYHELARVIATAALVEKNRSVIEQFLRIAESRYAVGQGAQADVLKAHTQLARMSDELLRVSRERPVLEAELKRALGREPSAAAPLPGPARILERALDAGALERAAFASRPQLLALEQVIARNGKALELARKDYYPDFDVRLSYGQRERMPDGTPRSDLVSVTVAINLPVWQARKRAPRVEEASAMIGQARMAHEAQRKELAARLRQQVAMAEQSRRSARLYAEDIVPQARLTTEASLAAYRVGRVDFMTLLDSQMTAFNAEIAHAGAVADHAKALAEIEFLVGKPLD